MPPAHTTSDGVVLVAGATGYVGGRLREALEATGLRVRCLGRRPEHLEGRVHPGTEIVGGDVLDPASLRRALEGIASAFYLVRCTGAGGDEEKAQDGARNFAEAARRAGVARIIYLGEIGEDSPVLGASWRAIGYILRSSGVPTVELRASIIIGSGSSSFEIARGLARRLPFTFAPRWMRAPAQPIAIEDVIAYLVAALESPPEVAGVFEIGGRDRATFADVVAECARREGRRHRIVPLPFDAQRASSAFAGLLTPVYAHIAHRLVESLRRGLSVGDPEPARVFGVEPRGYGEAIARALACEGSAFARTRWSDAVSSRGEPPCWDGASFASRFIEARETRIGVTPDRAFRPIERIGGRTGWYSPGLLWRARGWLDLLANGAGMRRGRRDPERLWPGDTVDAWRVEKVEPGRRLRLAAELKLPGRAWLEFEIVPDGAGCLVRQTAVFDPVGIEGKLYWYALYPVHQFIFAAMLRGIERESVG